MYEIPSEHRSTLFYCDVVKQWNGLPREVAEILKTQLDAVLDNLL